MKGKFQQLEQQIQHFVEKQALRILGIPDVESELSQRLVQAMQAEVHTDNDGKLIAPNIFTLNINPKFATDLQTNQDLLDTLALHVAEVGKETGVNFDAAVNINIFPDENVAAGDFKVHAMWKPLSNGFTESTRIELDTDTPSIPANAFLIIDGADVYNLEKEVVNIGRKLDNDLVLDDPRVSRKHSQLRAIKGHYTLFDLDSSGGSFVNGERTRQMVLRPGDVISLAGIPLVYGEDAVLSLEETRELQPINKEDFTKNSSSDDK